MIFKDYFPQTAISEFVDVFHLRHFIVPKNAGKLPFKPYPPRPEQCLAFYPRGFETTEIVSERSNIVKPRSVITGQYVNRINRHISSEFLMILVVCKPGALHRLTGIPFHELTNGHLDLESLYPKESREVNQRLNSCNEYGEMIRIIETFLLQLNKKFCKEPRPIDRMMELVLRQPGNYSLDWLAAQSCLSPRQMERNFRDYLGVGPKTFLRIIRFHQSYNRRLKHATEDWLSNAVACGYHDYQHLVRDYKEFTNTTPNLFFSEENKAPERVLGLHQ